MADSPAFSHSRAARTSAWTFCSAAALLAAVPAAGLALLSPCEESVKVNGPLVPGGDVSNDIVGDSWYRISPDNSRVVYVADQDTVNVHELYSVSINGPVDGPPIKLNGPLVGGGDVRSGLISPDGARVAYFADQDTNGVQELYSAPIDGSLPAVKLNGPLVPGGIVYTICFSPDGSRVIYLADQDLDNVTELFSVPVDGSQAAVKLNLPLGTGEFVGGPDVLISPDGAFVVFGRSDGSKYDIFSAPIDGSQPAVQLNVPTIVGNVGLYYFQISGDSSRVAYEGVQHDPGHISLYSVPIDGSALPIVLEGVLSCSDSDVCGGTGPARTTDTDVVFRGDPDEDGRADLYRVPIDGSAPPTRLTGPVVAFGGIGYWQLSSDGTTVVYRADQDTNEVYELYSLAVDGSSPAVKLNGPLVAGGNVITARWTIVPGDRLVLYVADQEVDGVFDLYSVPIDGSSPPTKLGSQYINSQGYPPPYGTSPQGNAVIYASDQEVPGVSQVYVVPLDGEPIPVTLTCGDAPYGVLGYVVSPDGSRAVYRDDQDTAGIYELYASRFVPAIDSLSDSQGSFQGGNTITIVGQGFRTTTSVSFGGVAASSVTFISPTELVVVVPRTHALPPPTMGPASGKIRQVQLPSLTVDVTVSNGGFTDTLSDGYIYLPVL